MPYGKIEIVLLVISFAIFLVVLKLLIDFISCYQKYRKLEGKKEYAGCEVIRQILDHQGLKDVYVIEKDGKFLAKYFKRRVITLSPDFFHGDSYVALAISALAAGYAIEDQRSPKKISLYMGIDTAISFLSLLSILGILIFVMEWNRYYLVLCFFALMVLFLLRLCIYGIDKQVKEIALQEIKACDLLTQKEEEIVVEVLHQMVRKNWLQPFLFPLKFL